MGWFLVNIIVPLTIPPLGVLLLRAVFPVGIPAAQTANFQLMTLVKDGQLGWIAAGMCAASFYEFAQAIIIYNDHQKHIPPYWFVILIPLVLSIIGAMFVAAVGAAYSTETLNDPTMTIRVWILHYRTFAVSAVITISSAITLTTVHFMVPESLIVTAGGGH